MSSELHNGFGKHNEYADTATSQALEFIDTVAFELQLNHDARQLEQDAEQAEKDRIRELERDASLIAEITKWQIKGSIIGDWSYIQSFKNIFDTPEEWLLYRKHFALLQPDADTCKNYGVTIDAHSGVIDKTRRPVIAAILSQSPTVVDGNLLYDTIGVADITSGILSNSPDGSGRMIINTDWEYRLAQVSKSVFKPTYEIRSPFKIHLVHFKTPELFTKEIIVPEKEEVKKSYDPDTKKFTLHPGVFTKYNTPAPVTEMDNIDKLYPEQLKDHPEFFSNVIAFISSCNYFTDDKFDGLEEISEILEKYK